MSNPKEKHYWTQLRAALTAGQWAAPSPAKAPNGAPLSWAELFRKFNKHCRGFKDVADVASQIHALALLLAANAKDEDEDRPVKQGQSPLSLGSECILPEERIGEASAGYDVLKGIESSNFDTLNFALAYYAYALGNPSECLTFLGKIPDVRHVESHIPLQGSTRSSISGLQVPGRSAEPSISSVVGSFISDITVPADVKEGRAWSMTETLRSLCLQGMSHEKLSPSDPQIALAAYRTALPLISIAESEMTSSSASIVAGKMDFTSFTRYRELWRWTERLIWRAVILTARTANIRQGDDAENSLWRWLGHYAACSAYWPSTFRTSHRSTISVIYLRALVLRHAASPSLPTTDVGKPPAWLHTARSIVQDYRAILSVSTTFPRAGKRNVKVEEFVDLCVAVWEASGAVGEYAGWVLDVLWWATRLTFNSFRILRHMTRLLYVSGDTSLAKRTFKLYVQVVGKAWQANDGAVGDDTDSDRCWVETLISGSRMLCKLASQLVGQEGIEDVREAGKLIEKSRTRLDKGDKQLVATVELADGIWNSVMAVKEEDSYTRPNRLAAARAAFLRSVETHPTPSGYFHLALSLARTGPSRDVNEAIVNAGLAVEGDAKEPRYWHLLGLLLTATEQWSSAQEILERGAQIGEDDYEEEALEDEEGDADEGDNQTLRVPAQRNGNVEEGNTRGRKAEAVNGKQPTDGLSNGDSEITETKSIDIDPIYVLDQDATSIPAAAGLLRPILDHYPPSKQDFFEYGLQLRMTQAALTESIEGAEGASEKWVKTFSWVAEKKAVGESPPRASIDGRMSIHSPPGPDVVLTPPEERRSRDTVPQPSHIPLGSSVPPPITVSPASPLVEHDSPAEFTSEKKSHHNKLRVLRSHSSDRDSTRSGGVRRMLKERVHKEQARITTISRKIGSGVVRNGSLRRPSSTPDFHAVLQQTSYQASSIHSRRRLSSYESGERTPNESPPPPPLPAMPPAQPASKSNTRVARENRLLSDLWLMAAATFRRQGKIEQAKGAIQEAEVRDEDNPAVWVQLGLYYIALGQRQNAIDALQKALFINPDDVSASVHLCRIYLSPEDVDPTTDGDQISSGDVDLASGMLSHLTRGVGWDVSEAWYFLAKAYRIQGMQARARECLSFALELSEQRGVRDVGTALGWCI